MELSPREKDKLMIFTAALLAERRKDRGIKLNYPESIALISAAIMEGAREGRTVSELMDYGRSSFRKEMMDVSEMISDIQVGTYQMVPNWRWCMTQLCRKRNDSLRIVNQDGDIQINEGETISILVANNGDRLIQVGSHYHFYETNDALDFDRQNSVFD